MFPDPMATLCSADFPKNKYNVGDFVVVRSDLELRGVCGNRVWYKNWNGVLDIMNSSMLRYKGQTVLVTAVTGVGYWLNGIYWSWTEEMLEPYDDINEVK